MNPRILIVDDHEIVREGIRTLLAKSGKNWEVCGEACNASDAIVAIKSLHPQVVVLDVSMPGISGLEAARLIGKLDLSTRVLIFTMHESTRLESEVRDAGAHGYVLKSQAARDLVRAIQTLLSGGTFFAGTSEPSPGSGENPGRGSTFFSILTWPSRLRQCVANLTPISLFVCGAKQLSSTSIHWRTATTLHANLLNYP